ncbi:MAG: hydrolase [Pseudomonadota bacterium]
MLQRDNTVLVLIDVQEKLLNAMHGKDALLAATVKMVQGAKVLGLPIVWTEQNPKGLGSTVPEVKDLLADSKPITKLSFSCCGEKPFVSRLDELGCKQVLIGGIECHVCVYQTVADLCAQGFDVQVVADTVSSRTPENRAVGLERCRDVGARVTSVETALFELLKVAEGDRFKAMLKVVK